MLTMPYSSVLYINLYVLPRGQAIYWFFFIYFFVLVLIYLVLIKMVIELKARLETLEQKERSKNAI